MADKTLKQLVDEFLEAQDLADKTTSALLNSGHLNLDQTDVKKSLQARIDENADFQQLFRALELLNTVNDNMLYLLLEKHEEKAAQLARGVLTLVMKANIDLEDLVRSEQDGEYRAALMVEADRRVQAIGGLETRFFKQMQENPELFKRANDLMYAAMDDLNPKVLDTETDTSELVIVEGADFITLFAQVNGEVEGALVRFDINGQPEFMELYEEGEFVYGFEFDEGGESGSLDFPDEESGGILPVVGAIGGAALLTAAVVMKISSKNAQEVINVPSTVEVKS